MKCSKCGKTINEHDSFCPNCGVSLNNSSNKYSRGALKEDAKKKISKPLMLMTLIYLILNVIGNFIIEALDNVNFTPLVIFGVIIFLVLLLVIETAYSFNIYSNILNDKKEKTLEETILIFVKDIKTWLKFTLLILVVSIAIFVIAFLSCIILSIADTWLKLLTVVILIISFIFVYPILNILMFSYIDKNNRNKNLIEHISYSFNFTKENIIKFYALHLSFIFWHLLSILTLGILYIWVLPYIAIAQINLYKQWNKEELFISDQKEIQDKNIVWISLLIFSVVIIALLSFFVKDGFSSNNKIANLVLDNQTISFKVPDNFTVNRYESTTDYLEYDKYNADGDYITYDLIYHYDENYEYWKKTNLKNYKESYYNIKLNEYETIINNITVQVFSINYTIEKEDKDYYHDTFVYYPLNADYAVEIVISMNEVNKDNLKDYLKLNTQ